MVKYVESVAEWTAHKETSKTKLLVVDFTASWCGPCKMIAPIFEELEKSNPDVLFVKVDVDDQDKISAECNIQAMPTFQFYKGGKMVFEMKGADAQTLTDKVAEFK